LPEERAVKGAEISVFAHATEDEAKVKQAVQRIARYEHTWDEQKLSGHYDDPIILLNSKTAKKKDATDALTYIVNKLNSLDRETLLSELPNRVDPQGNLYMRLDKQKAYHGRAVLNDSDPIRIKFKFQLPHKADPVLIVREFIINAEEDDSE